MLKIRKWATRSVIANLFVGWTGPTMSPHRRWWAQPTLQKLNGVIGGAAGNRLATSEPGVHGVPVLDLRLAELPAEIRLVAVDHRREIDETGHGILQLDA